MNATCDMMRSDTCKLHHTLPAGSIVNLHHATDDLQTHKSSLVNSKKTGSIGSFHKMYSTPCLLKSTSPHVQNIEGVEKDILLPELSLKDDVCTSESEVECLDSSGISTDPCQPEPEHNADVAATNKDQNPEPPNPDDALALVPYEPPKNELTDRPPEVLTCECEGGPQAISWLVLPPTPTSPLDYCNGGCANIEWGRAYSDAPGDTNVVVNNTSLLGPYPFPQGDFESGFKHLKGHFSDLPIPLSMPLLVSLQLPPLPMLNLMDGLIDKDRLMKLSQSSYGSPYPFDLERLSTPSYPSATPWYHHYLQSPPSSNSLSSSPLIFSIIDPKISACLPAAPENPLSGVLVPKSNNNDLLTAALPKFQFKMRKKDGRVPHAANKPPLLNEHYDNVAAGAMRLVTTSPMLATTLCCPFRDELVMCCDQAHPELPPLDHDLVTLGGLAPSPPPNNALMLGPLLPPPPPPSCCLTPQTPFLMCPECLPPTPLDHVMSDTALLLFYPAARPLPPSTFMLPPPPFEPAFEPPPPEPFYDSYLYTTPQPLLGPPPGTPLFEQIPYFLLPPPPPFLLAGGQEFSIGAATNQPNYYGPPHLDYGHGGDFNIITSSNTASISGEAFVSLGHANNGSSTGGNYTRQSGGGRGRTSDGTANGGSNSSSARGGNTDNANNSTTNTNGYYKGSSSNNGGVRARNYNDSNGSDEDEDRRNRRRPSDYSNTKRRNHAAQQGSNGPSSNNNGHPNHQHHRIPESPDYGLGSDAESSVNHAENEEVSPLVLILSSIQDVVVFDITESCARVRWKALPVGQSEPVVNTPNGQLQDDQIHLPLDQDHRGTPTPTLISLPAAPTYRVYLFTTTSTRASFLSKKGGPGRGNLAAAAAGLLCPPAPLGWAGDSASSLLNAQPGDGTCVYSGPLTECSIKNLCPFKEYEICVAATLNNLRGRLTRAVLFKTLSTIPETPLPPVLSLKGKNFLTIKWVNPLDNGSKITIYTLQSAPCSAESGDLPRGETLSDLYVGQSKQFKATKLKPASAYAFRLAAFNSHGQSPWSPLVTFWTSGATPTQPKAPELLKAGPDFLTLSWERQTCSDGASRANEPCLGYTLQMEDCASGHGFVTLYNSNYQATTAGKNGDFGKPIVYTTPPNLIHRNSTYNFRLRTCNEEGYSPWSEVVSFASTPAAPTPPKKLGVKGKPQPTYLKITWVPPTDDGGSPIQEYVLQMKSRDQPKYETVYEGGAEREAACQNLAPGSFYVFRARCKTQAGLCSCWSEEFMVCTPATLPSPCPPPAITSCSAHTNKSKASTSPGSTLYSLALRWGPPELDGGSPISEYELQMATGLNETRICNDESIETGCELYKTVYQGPANEYYINDLAPVTQYNFRLRCANVIGWSPWSEPQSHITGNGVPGSPGQPILSVKSSFAIAICYAQPEQTNGSPVKEYLLEARCPSLKLLEPSSSAPPLSIGSEFSKIYQGPDLTFECKNLEPCQTYEFRVAALNEMGQGAWSTVATLTLPPAVPTAIPGSALSLVRVHSDWAEIAWLEPDSRGSPILKYAVEVADSQHGGTQKSATLCETEGPACHYHISDLLPLHPYRVRVQAINGIGVGPFSPPIKFTTLSRTPTVAPSFKGIEGISPHHVKLRWEFEAGDSNAAKTTFELEMADYRKNFNLIYTGDNTSYKATKLTENSTYYFRIRALNEAGFGPYSSILTLKTSWAPPNPIKNIKIVRCKPDSCHISWSYPMNHHQHLYLQDLSLVREPNNEVLSSDLSLPEGSNVPIAWNVVFRIYLAGPDSKADAQSREVDENNSRLEEGKQVDSELSEHMTEEQGTDYKLVHTCSDNEFTFKQLHPSTAHKVRVQPVRIFSRAITHHDQTPIYSIEGVATDPLLFQTPAILPKPPVLSASGNTSQTAVTQVSRLASIINALSRILQMLRLNGHSSSSQTDTQITGGEAVTSTTVSQNWKKGTYKSAGKTHNHVAPISSGHPKPSPSSSSKRVANGSAKTTFPQKQQQQPPSNVQQKFSQEQRWALLIMGAFVLLAIGTTFAVAYVGQFL